MKIISIAGARPNFMKLASIARAAEMFNMELQGKGLSDSLYVCSTLTYMLDKKELKEYIKEDIEFLEEELRIREEESNAE